MSVDNQKNSLKNLLTLLGVTSASVLLSLPALAAITANQTSLLNGGFEQTLNNRKLAQNNSNTNQQNTGGTNSTQQSPADSINNQQNRNRTNTNPGSPADSNLNQQNPSSTGTTQQSPADSNLNQQNPSSTGTNQQNPAATGGTNQQNRTGTRTNQQNPAATGGTNQQNRTGTGTNQQNPAATGRTNQQNPTATNSQNAGQQDPFTQYMLAGYAATQQRDYKSALTNFQRALQLRPNNPYAARAIRNVQGYLQRGG